MNIRKINWIIIQKLNKIFKHSWFDQIYWKYRACNGDWGENTNYLGSVFHSHRKPILDILKRGYQTRFFSVLEVGCNSGPNLIAIKKEFGQQVAVVGVDINIKAVKEGQKKGLVIAQGTADNIPANANSHSVVLADAVLMYVGPDKINKAISEMITVARDMIIIVDFHKAGAPEGTIELGHWVRDYVELFRKHGLKAQIRKITKKEWKSYSWEKLGHYIIVDLHDTKRKNNSGQLQSRGMSHRKRA